MSELLPGKVPPALLRELAFGRIGARRPEVLVGPGIGEDAAVLDLDGDLLVVSSDPITGASGRAGWLAVHVACNDIAATGARPVGVLVTILLPEDGATSHLDRLTEEVDRACREIGIAIVGGHTEVTTAVREPILSLTALGRASKGAVLSSGGAQVGDELILTKAAGLEGTAILATDFASELAQEVDQTVLERARAFWDDISVIPEARVAADAGATAMHDATEGGVLGAVSELAEAASLGVRVVLERIPRRPETDAICGYFGLDPLALVSSGALLVTAPREKKVVDRLRSNGIEATVIGEITASDRRLLLRGKNMPLFAPRRDELWRLLEERAASAG